MNKKLAVSLKKRLIQRVLRYTGVYTLEDLSQKTLQELQAIQSNGLISLQVKHEFKNRNN